MAIRAGHKVVVSDFDSLGVVAWKTATETVTSSTTLQADDQLFLPVVTNAKYIMDMFLVYSGQDAATGGNLKLQFTGPSGATLDWANFGVNTGGLTQYNVVGEAIAAGSPRAVGTNGAGVKMCARPMGTLTTASTSGNLALLWAQNSSNATGTVIHAGTFLRLYRVA